VRLPRSVETADVSGRRVLVRADLNVPLAAGQIADDTRIRAALPTLRWLLDHGASEVVVCSHLGRPETADDRRRLSIIPVADRLRALLPDPRIRLLENTRFDPRETRNESGFAHELVEGIDLYVNDAFGSAHRAHSSTEAVAHLVPAYAGLLLLAELEHLGRLLGEVEHPFVIVAGGAKVDDKVAVLEHLGGRADRVLIGGKMAEQLREHNPLPFPVDLPVDVVAASAFAEDAEACIATVDAVPAGWLGLDIGPATAEAFGAIVREARTIFWNGPMGVFEWSRFAVGTSAVAEAVADADAYSVVGGGDSVRALQELGLADRVSWVSTGGGASLELLEGRDLPGVAAIPEA
jgi:phosphoglycerate kinase